MMKEDEGYYRAYRPRKFNDERMELIRQINIMISNYATKGLALTVRQIYYQFVTLNIVPNNGKSYDKVQSAIADGRMAGLISWTAIEDRGRSLQGWRTHSTPQKALSELAKSYKRDVWETQPFRVEVWVEKAALIGVVQQICAPLRVDYYTQRGYNSQSQQWEAGQRFANYIAKGQRVIVFHLGDHDPSGIDMTRSNTELLELFAGTPINVQRLALNRDQIDKYNPPPQPAKRSDARFETYKEEHGTESWELDALEPTVIQALISDAVLRVRDEDLFREQIIREEEEKRWLESHIEE